MKFCFYGSIAKGLKGKPIGGGEQQLALIAKYLNKTGQQVAIIDFDILEDENIEGIKIYSLRKRVKSRFYKFITFYKLLKQINPDVYYARIRSGIHFLALMASRSNNSLFVYHLASDLDALSIKERYLGFYSKYRLSLKLLKQFIQFELIFPLLIRLSDLLIVQNKEQYNILINKGYKHVHILNNLYEYNQGIEDINDFKVNDYFIYIGSLDKRKGIDELFTVFKSLTESNFVIIGSARDSYSKNLIQNHLPLNVINLGQKSHGDVLCYLAKSKGLINTSPYEGFSNAFIEAWSLGVPVFSLSSDPSKVINEFHLGRSFNGNINNMVQYISNYKPLTIEKKMQIIKYVEKNHLPKEIIKRLILILENYVT